MKVFLSGFDTSVDNVLRTVETSNTQIPFALASFYHIQKSGYKNFKTTLEHCDEMLIDSGAHSFQKGKKVPWEEYTDKYAQFIKEHDCDKILGYFEMDVDNQIGYERVLQLRKKLLAVTDKIIPVWHKNRGIDEFKKMCHETKGNIVAVTGFKNEDIIDKQYGAFVKYAWSCGKKIHCLGMTRTKVLNKIPFDYVDSSSWKQKAVYGGMVQWDNKRKKLVDIDVPKRTLKTNDMFYNNLKAYIEFAKYYNIKWHKVNNDLHFRIGVRKILHKLKLRRFLFMNNEKAKSVAKIGVLSALYVILTVLIAPFSYGAIQIRLSEMFNHMINFNKRYIYALILGCAVANINSPLGPIDLFFGVLGTALSSYSIYFINKKVDNFKLKFVVSTLIPVFFTFTVALELNIVNGLPFLLTWGTIAVGEFISCLIGAFLTYAVSKRYDLTK